MSRRAHLRVAAPGLLLLLALAAAGCGGSDVHVSRFSVTPEGHESCQALLAALPHKVADQPRRRTSGSTYAAAWGKPPIVLRCGVGRPAGYNKFSACQTTDGVDWFVPEPVMEDQTADVVMTTVGRSPNLEVKVPSEYRPGTAPMVDLAKAIKQHTREVTPCS